MANIGFTDWMKAVDDAVYRKQGCSVHDLPDCCYFDWYEDDMSPARAAAKAIRSAREE